MPTFGRIRTLCRFIKQEGIAPTFIKITTSILGLVYRSETAYIFARSVDKEPPSLTSPTFLDEITIDLLHEDRIDKLAMIGYCERGEIVRRIKDGQKCIFAEHRGNILHYSWLTSKSEYAGEIEMMIPIETGETYLYNCRTLAQARGKGIFPAVIARALEETAKSGATHMLALVSRNNRSSIRAFEKMLFKVRQETKLVRFLIFREHHTRKSINHD